MSNEEGGNRPGALVLAGGGIDSTLCIHQLVRDGYSVRAFHIDYGQRASGFEWESVRHTARAVGIEADHITVSPAVSPSGPEVIGRNAALICIALLHARRSERLICVGVHAGTPFFDCSTAFIERIARLVAEQTDSRVRLIAPLVTLSKPEIVARARALELPLAETYSCQEGVMPPCGQCHSCLDREATGC
jgi:7-cyano-7-deazaguanine synthase